MVYYIAPLHQCVNDNARVSIPGIEITERVFLLVVLSVKRRENRGSRRRKEKKDYIHLHATEVKELRSIQCRSTI